MGLRFDSRRLLIGIALAALAFAGLAFAVESYNDAVEASVYSRYRHGYFTRAEARRLGGPIVDTWPDPTP
jgi:hypothetical protein